MSKYCSGILSFAVVIVVAGVNVPKPAVARNLDDLLHTVRSAIQQSLKRTAESARKTEVGCIDQSLHREGDSVAALIHRDVSSFESRIAQTRSDCQDKAPTQSPRPASTQSFPYVVDELALGERVGFESDAYKRYRCGPSDRFPGFIRCHKEKTEKTERGDIKLSNDILHSRDGTARYVNRQVDPAFFGPDDVNSEMDRLSRQFGERPRQIPMPPHDGLLDGIIAVWGELELVPLGSSEVATVASGGSTKELLVGFLGDPQRSAQTGLPVYRLAGGPGFLWAAAFNRNGRGVLRYLTVDTSQITPVFAAADKAVRRPASVISAPVEASLPSLTETEQLKPKVTLAKVGEDAVRTAEEAVRFKLTEVETARQAIEESLRRNDADAKAERSTQNMTLVAAFAIIILLCAAVVHLFNKLRELRVKAMQKTPAEEPGLVNP